VLRAATWSVLAALLPALGTAATVSTCTPLGRANLKHSQLVLQEADYSLATASSAYRADDPARVSAALTDFLKYIDQAYACLAESGTNPLERPRHFKRAEIYLRKLSRKLDNLRRQMRFDDQEILEVARIRVDEVDEALVIGLVGAKSDKAAPNVLAQN
jgi:hypothetical protein